jgi:hypothetical protein
MSGPTDVDERYVVDRVGRDVRVVRKSGTGDVIGKLKNVERFTGGAVTLVIETWPRTREQRVEFADVAALYVRG